MNSNNARKLSEKELDAIYIYLDMNFDAMTADEKQMWIDILDKIEKENHAH
jgi:hypothetical protein